MPSGSRHRRRGFSTARHGRCPGSLAAVANRPAIGAVSSGLNGLAAFISGDGGEGSAGRSAAVAAGAVAAGAVGLKAGGALLRFLNPLQLAGTTLTSAGTQLIAAAAALRGAAGLPAVGAGAGGGAVKGVARGAGRGGLAGIIGGIVATQVLDRIYPRTNADEDIAAMRDAYRKRHSIEATQAQLGELVNLLASRRADLAGLGSDPLSQMFAGPLKSDIASLQSQVDAIQKTPEGMAATFQSGTDLMQAAFNIGAMDVTTGIGTAATAFGPAAGQGLLAVAPAIGAAMAEAFRSTVGSINVNANVTAREVPRMDTAPAIPF